MNPYPRLAIDCRKLVGAQLTIRTRVRAIVSIRRQPAVQVPAISAASAHGTGRLIAIAMDRVAQQTWTRL